MMATAERRMYTNNDENTTIRLSDFISIIPAVNGKLELVYEGEQEGSYIVVLNLIGKTIKSVFNKIFPVISEIKKDKKSENPYAKILKWFEKNKLNINNDISDREYSDLLVSVDGLQEFVKNHLPKIEERDLKFYMEFLLHGISENSLISKKYTSTSVDFKDLISDIFSAEQK
tara:strand:- start:170 stop:688 length:519 start_codon:yes stop_codon:yes gene_type:complete